MKIVVIGPTQSGKTCLAVGLSTSSYVRTLFRPAFQASADNEISRQHLLRLRKLLESGKWPPGTTRTDKLQFAFQWKKRRRIEFTFGDYKGENSTSPDFLKKLGELGSEDGVVLLVNPGFKFHYVEESDGTLRFPNDAEASNPEALDSLPVSSAFAGSPLARTWLVDEEGIYEQIVEALKTMNGETKTSKPVVAVAVTASDRLRRKGDLRSIRPQFEEFLARITNKLETAGFRWKRFDVSVTGSLAKQNEPKLGRGLANTSPRPFLWIVRRRIGPMVKKIAIPASSIVALLALVFGAYEYSKSIDDDKSIGKWHSSCLSALEEEPFEIGHLKTASTAIDRLRSHKGFYAEKARREADELEKSVWKKQNESIQDESRKIEQSNGKKGSKSDIDIVNNWFSAFTPTVCSNEWDKLQSEWNEKSKGLFDAYLEHQVIDEIDKILADPEPNHGIGVMASLYPLSGKISESKPKTPDGRTNLSNRADQVDCRIDEEWRNFVIPDFENTVSTNATHGNVRAFRTRLAEWSPVSTTGVVAKADLVAYVSNGIPVWRTNYESNRLVRSVCEPIRKLVDSHGEEVRNRLTQLGGEFQRVVTNDTQRELTIFVENCRIRLDNRFSNELDHLIEEFSANATEQATEDAFSELRNELAAWNPLSTKSLTLWSNNLATVDSFKTFWRATYETNRFVSVAESNLADRTPKTLAMFYPDNASTNAYLTRSFIESVWNGRIQKPFEEACSNLVRTIVRPDPSARKRPELSDEQKEKLKAKASEIGRPLKEDSLLRQAETMIANAASCWDEEKRKLCQKWWAENENKKDRFGDTGLLSAYARAHEGLSAPLKSVPPEIFDQEVCSKVYSRVEKWFEEDVRFFNNEIYPAAGVSVWDDNVNSETRFEELKKRFEDFRQTCLAVQKDENAPSSSWAKRFALLCLQESDGGGNIRNGELMKAFPIKFEIQKVEGWIRYKVDNKTFPTGYKHTSFAFGFEYGKNYEDWIVKPDDDGDAPEDGPFVEMEDEQRWKDLMPEYETTPKQVSVSFFQYILFIGKATDYNTYISAPACTGKISEERFFPPVSDQSVDFGGTIPLSCRTENGWHTVLNDRPVFKIRLSLHPTSNASPLVLLNQAKNPPKKDGSK